MKSEGHLGLALLSSLLLAACGAESERDFFGAVPGSTSDATSNTSIGGATSSTSSSVTSGGASGTTSTSAVSNSAATTSVATMTTSAGSGDSTTTGPQSMVATGVGGGAANTASASSGAGGFGTSSSTNSGAPTLVTVELPTGEDCIEAACPAEAPYLSGCEILFSVGNDLNACVAAESDGAIFIKSGDGCAGSYVVQGTLACSSIQPVSLEAIAAECMVTNKDTPQIVDDRCECTTPSGTPGCS